jgi:hypothetical protein
MLIHIILAGLFQQQPAFHYERKSVHSTAGSEWELVTCRVIAVRSVIGNRVIQSSTLLWDGTWEVRNSHKILYDLRFSRW